MTQDADPIGPDRPVTTVAWLVTEGSGPRRFTRHRYVRAVDVSNGARLPRWQLIYKCQETGAERVWGLQ